MQAVAQLGDVDVYTSAFRPMRNTISGATGRTLMKLLVHSDSGRVVGAHMVSEGEQGQLRGVGTGAGVRRPLLTLQLRSQGGWD